MAVDESDFGLNQCMHLDVLDEVCTVPFRQETRTTTFLL